MAKELKRRTSKTIELRSLDLTTRSARSLSTRVQWIARIMWASK
jgi:phage repressor protein C with HTH and peptisase S24 domain